MGNTYYYENYAEVPADVVDSSTCKEVLKMLGALTPGMRKCMRRLACRIEDYFFDSAFQHSLRECYEGEGFNPLPHGDGKLAITAMNPGASSEEEARIDFERNLWYVPSPRRGENRRGYHARLRAWLNLYIEHLLCRGRTFEDAPADDYYQYDYLDDGQVIYLELIEAKNDFSFDHGALNIGEF